MNYLTDKKLTIVGAAGMIGSNMAQTALMMKLTPNICLYDPYVRLSKVLPKKCFNAVLKEQILLLPAI